MNKANKKQLEKKMERAERSLSKRLGSKKRREIKRAVDRIFEDYGKTLIRLGRT